jgi:hypothetical protein
MIIIVDLLKRMRSIYGRQKIAGINLISSLKREDCKKPWDPQYSYFFAHQAREIQHLSPISLLANSLFTISLETSRG